METVLRRWGPALLHAAPGIASTILILAIAWQLAHLTWMLLPQPTAATADRKLPGIAARRIDVESIAERHLFGTATVSTGNVDAPDTSLALTLHGIVSGDRAADSYALIVINGDEELYGVGAQLQGGAVIRAIFPDRVLLARDGRIEALRLPKGDTANAVANSFNVTAAPPSAPVPQNLGQLRQEIIANPQRLMDVIRVFPVTDKTTNKLTGYRVYPTGNASAFTQLGLKPGDVVTAVNGIPLTDPAESMRVLASLKTSEQVSITLNRDGQSQTQVLQLQDQNP